MKLSEFGRLGAVRSWLAMSASVFVLAACGGGDGTAAAPPPAAASSPPPPPPPPPVSTNTAPVATILTDNATPDEGQPFMVDASSSTDPDNDALTFMWTQTAGPDLEIADPTSPTQSFTAPELTETVTVTLEVEVSDGELVNTASVDVQLMNIDLSPDFDPFGSLRATIPTPDNSDLLLAVSFGGGVGSLLSVAADTASSGAFLLENIPNGASDVAGAFAPGQLFTGPLSVARDALSVGAISAAGTDIILVAEEGGNQLSAVRVPQFSGPSDTIGEVIVEQSIAAPCTVEQGLLSDVGVNIDPIFGSLNGRPVFVGKRNSGFSVFETLEFSTLTSSGGQINLLQAVDTGQSLCAISAFNGPISPSVLALDDDDPREVHLFTTDPGAPNFQLTQSAILDFDNAEDLQLVASANSGSSLILAYTDGEHRGEHRIVVVSLDALTGDIIQQTLRWDVGIPSDIELTFAGQPSGTMRAIVVITSTSPEAVIFEPDATGERFSEEPSFAQIGLGASSAVVSGPLARDLRVAFPDANEIREFGF